MSWLARSLANTLRLDDDKPDVAAFGAVAASAHSPASPSKPHPEEDDRSDAQGRGVKEDLSEFRETLTRQLWGVASFLAPPPSQPSTPSRCGADPSVSDWDRSEPSDPSVSGEVSGEDTAENAGISSIRSDIAGIGGKFRTGFSKLSHHRAVSEISKMASNFLPFGSEKDEGEWLEEYDLGRVAGVTNEVLAFAKNIAMHPETWLDFPLEEEEDLDDFDLSDAQQEHAWVVERLLPRLAALRIELCPGHMTESYFWKVYFVLLLSRLKKQDAELLSSPQVMAARARWMQELQKRTKQEQGWSRGGTPHSKDCSNLWKEDFVCSSSCNACSENMPFRTNAFESAASATTDIETEKHPVVSSEMQIIDKSVIEEKPMIWTKDKDVAPGSSSKVILQTYEDDGDDWPEEENSDLAAYRRTTIPLGNEEDVSFSDLEDDDYDCSVPVKSKVVP
ncbi:uncharacterized protein LOC131162446 [Malania oleifera]|uniref:uncharacterized protein LOC131162446 n=1 Tax=Malania oleifera TaxID=397392 RepID=UPI0025ADFF96|nr:uncharacterized protein LOC131162446 [Malania oleifera]